MSGAVPSAMAMAKPMTVVNTICPMPVASATGPTLLTTCMSSSRPTTNSSTVTPICASKLTWSCAITQPSADGPSRMPTTM